MLVVNRLASLPSRERGLKLPDPHNIDQVIQSLPSRERGLKFHKLRYRVIIVLSLPSRERGLKLWEEDEKMYTVPVAPLAGAWIEIQRASQDRL